MASLIKVTRKKQRVYNPLFADEKFTGTEPAWDTALALKFDSVTFDGHLRRSLYYYNYYYSGKEMKPKVVEFLKTTPLIKDGKELSAKLRKSDVLPVVTVGSLVMAHARGMPLKQNHLDFIVARVKDAISSDKGTYTEPAIDDKLTKKADKKTDLQQFSGIQERLQEKVSTVIGELEGVYDEVIRGKLPEPKVAQLCEQNKVPFQLVGQIKQVWEQRKADIIEASKSKDAQIREAYSRYKVKDFKRFVEFLDKVLGELAQYSQMKKATRKVRTKKAPSKEKLVAKLKYCKTFAQLKIASIQPQDILGANELWIYNTKTRKLGRYVAEDNRQLSIKGTTLLNYDEGKSVCKTLRKPGEQLAAFAKAGKPALRTFLKSIVAVEQKLNGRFNGDIVLLRALT